jgi:hypothetical protein
MNGFLLFSHTCKHPLSYFIWRYIYRSNFTMNFFFAILQSERLTLKMHGLLNWIWNPIEKRILKSTVQMRLKGASHKYTFVSSHRFIILGRTRKSATQKVFFLKKFVFLLFSTTFFIFFRFYLFLSVLIYSPITFSRPKLVGPAPGKRWSSDGSSSGSGLNCKR